MLHIGDHNDDSLSDRSLTDETTPLIDEEPERPPEEPEPPAEKSKQPAAEPESEVQPERPPIPPARVKPPLLPKPQHIPQKHLEFARPEFEKRTTNPFEFLINSQTDNLQVISESYASQFSQVETSFEVSKSSSLGSRIETSFQVSKSSSLDSRIFSRSKVDATTTAASDFHSLEEIHQQFNSDKESLIEKSYSSYGRLMRKQLDHDRSNRSSWRSNSDLETGDEARSRSSSINDNDYWLKASPKSSSSGSPVVKAKLDVKDEGEDKAEAGGDDDSLENSSSENSYSVRRRLKQWFGSFGKAGKAAKRRDSTFYLDNENKNMWETTSISSGEDKNDITNDVSVEEPNDGDATMNGNAEPLTEEEKQERKAFYVVKELISSEKVFIDVLKLLTVDFVNCVKNADRDNPVVPDAELVKIINYLPQLQLFNEELLRDFECRLENWPECKKISDIIIKKGPFLKLFSTYIQNFEKQCNQLDEACNKYHRFAKVVKDFEASERCKKLTLKHYMLKPVQRLPQYRLLLEDYLSHQNPESPDYSDTEKALKIVCGVADHANRSIEQGVSVGNVFRN